MKETKNFLHAVDAFVDTYFTRKMVRSVARHTGLALVGSMVITCAAYFFVQPSLNATALATTQLATADEQRVLDLNNDLATFNIGLHFSQAEGDTQRV